jgi:hypothetical protein
MAPPTDVIADDQLELGVAVRSALDDRWRALLGVLRGAVGAIDAKQGLDIAAECGVDPGQFSRALHGKGANFSLRWLIVVLWRDRSHSVIGFLCRLCGGEFVAKPRLTPEERIERLEQTLREAGAFGEAVLRAAYGEDEAA